MSTDPWQQPPRAPGPAPGVEFGGFAERLIAYIVDGLILGAVATVVAIVGVAVVALAVASGSGSGMVLGIGLGIIVFVSLVVVSLAYFPYFWAHGGATPGMRIFRLRVVRDVDGGPVSGVQAILRLIGYWVSATVFYLGFVWVFIDQRRRGWHDLIAGTVVIRQP